MNDSNKAERADKDSELVLSDDIESLKKQIKVETLDYVDVASLQAWEKALQTWPLLAEWHVWSKS